MPPHIRNLTWMARLTLAAETGGDGEAPAGGGDGGEAGGGGSSQDGKTAPAEPPKVEKPEGVPSSIWGDGSQFVKDGEIDKDGLLQALSDGYRHQKGKVFTRKDDLAKQVREELEAEYKGPREGVPESPDKYEFKISDELAEQLPEHIAVNLDENDPMVGWFRQTAHEYGLSQDKFQELLDNYVASSLANMPDFDQEMAKLGDYADQRLERVEGFVEKHLSDGAQQTLRSMAVRADTIQLFEEFMQLAGEPAFAMGEDGAVQETISREDIQKLMASEEYRRGDPATVRKVRNGFQKLSNAQAQGR